MHHFFGLPSPIGAVRRACISSAGCLTVLLLATAALPLTHVHGQTATAEPAGQVGKVADKDAKDDKDAKGTDKQSTEKQAKKKSPVIAQITLAGSIPDGVGQGGLLADVSPHLHRLIERLDKAATDTRVKGVVLSIESPAIGRGRAEELRAAIGRIRKAGKPVAAHLIGADPVHYVVASACDTVAMPPAATLEITGVRTEVTFFKAMLDKLEVNAEILQVGEFKGAGEPLTRTSMSPQLRAQYEQFVGDLYEQLVERIAADRKLTTEQVRSLIDTGVFTPEAAVKAKLIDAVAYEDEVISGLAGRLKLDEPKISRDYAEQKMDNDFSGIGGLVKLVELLSGQKQAAAAGKDKQIAIIYLTGEIKEGKGKDELLAGGSAGSDSVIKAIRDAAKDDKVAAIVLRVGTRQRPDLAGGRADHEAGGGEPLRRRRQRWLLRGGGGRQDRGSAGDAHWIDRCSRRQDRHRQGAGKIWRAYRRRGQGPQCGLALDADAVHRSGAGGVFGDDEGRLPAVHVEGGRRPQARHGDHRQACRGPGLHRSDGARRRHRRSEETRGDRRRRGDRAGASAGATRTF
jgi:ClpP class serine protease